MHTKAQHTKRSVSTVAQDANTLGDKPSFGVAIVEEHHGALHVMLETRRVPVIGFVSAIPGVIPALHAGDTVLVAEFTHGVLVHGVVTAVDATPRAKLEIQNGRLVVEAEAVVIKSRASTIELTEDGKVFVHGKRIVNVADGPMRLQGSIIELN